jgi:hypothetical protein
MGQAAEFAAGAWIARQPPSRCHFLVKLQEDDTMLGERAPEELY